MYKYCKLLTLYLIVVFLMSCHAQPGNDKVSLLDFQLNKKSELKILEDWSSQRILLIDAVQNDTTVIQGVSEIESKEVLNNRFLKVVYRVRQGSGMHVRQTRLFAMKGNNIYQSLALVSSYQSYASDGRLEDNFKIDVRVLERRDTFLLQISEDLGNPGVMVEHNADTLRFDKEIMTFKSKHNDSVHTHALCGPDKVLSKTPGYVLNLKTNKYLYREGAWYIRTNLGCYDLF